MLVEQEEEECGEVVNAGLMCAQLSLQRVNHQARMTLCTVLRELAFWSEIPGLRQERKCF